MLDAARAGTLSPRATVDLNAHLARCAACRMHLNLGGDFSIESRPARNESALVAGLVRAALAEPAAGASTYKYRSVSRGSRLLRRLMLPAACVLLGGGAATAMWSVSSELHWLPEIEPLPTVQQNSARAKARSHRAPSSLARPAAPAPAPAAPALEPEPIVEVTPSVSPKAPSPLPVVPKARPSHPARRAVKHAAAPAAEVVAVAPESPAPRPTAGGLFAEANRARRDGAYSRANFLYRQLRTDFSGSREEITARVIVGQLALAEGRWPRALMEFDSYLAASPNGTLAEEAQVGRALALMRLSRVDAERDAWTQLLKRHPSSMHADRARARLEALRP